MAYTKLIMQNQYTGEIKEAPVGFSWTTVFFGQFVPLVRGHYSGAAIWFFLPFITFGISIFVFPFAYNKGYVKYLINKGYQVKHSMLPIEVIASKLKMAIPVIEEE